MRIANEETSGLAAAIVAEDERRGPAVPRRLPRHGRLLERDRRGSPTASSSPARRRPASTSTGRRGRAGRSPTATSGCGSTASSATARRPVTVVVKLGSSLVAGPGGRVRRAVLARAGAGDRRTRRGGDAGLRRLLRRDRARAAAARASLPRPRSLPKLQAASALGQARLQRAWDEALGAGGARRGAGAPDGDGRGRPRRVPERSQHARRAARARRRARRERERRDCDRRDHVRRQRRARRAGRRSSSARGCSCC